MNIYCLRCKEHTDSDNVNQVTYKNGRHAVKATCSECGAGKSRILGNEEMEGGNMLFTTLKHGMEELAYKNKPKTIANATKHRQDNKRKWTDYINPVSDALKKTKRRSAEKDMKKAIEKQKATPEGQRLLKIFKETGPMGILMNPQAKRDLAVVMNRE